MKVFLSTSEKRAEYYRITPERITKLVGRSNSYQTLGSNAFYFKHTFSLIVNENYKSDDYYSSPFLHTNTIPPKNSITFSIPKFPSF